MLPVDAVLPELTAALRAQSAAVLIAPPGAGKTTRAPPALMAEPWAAHGKIVVLSPRRIAARAAAHRIAAELGEPVGRTIGFRVRLETRESAATRILIVTEGVFTRMILADPELSGVAGVVFDEAHERSLEGDLGLALALDAQAGLRPDLRLLVMSATIDGARFSRLMGDAPVIESAGRLFPIDTRYLGRGQPGERIEPLMARAVRQALGEVAGSILCFLPGVREIERTAEALTERALPAGVSVHPLHGGLEPRAQDQAIAPAPAGSRKIVLATAIAETSLTIEGVRIVIDSGLARRPVYEPGIGLTRLETQRASRASVDQRRGRAGRTEPGVCYRLWDEGETRGLAPYDRPEILEADLSGLALDLAAWGVSEPAALSWLDPPPPAAWREARELLSALGALDGDARLTAHGAALAGFGLHPRLAHMLIRAGGWGQARLAGQIAAILTEQGLGGPSPDLAQRLTGFARDRSLRAEGARRLAQRWVGASGGGAQAEPDFALAGQTLALAFPERVAKARDGRGAFLMANGRAAALDAGEGLAGKPFLAIANVTGAADRARIQLAAELTASEIEAAFGAEIVEDDTLSLDGPTGAVRARRVRRLGKITLSEAPLSAPPPPKAAVVLLEALKRKGPAGLAWPPAAQMLRARVALLKSLEPERWPDWTDEGLESALDAWAEAAVSGAMSLAQVEANLHDALRSQLDYAAQRALDALAPTHFTTPAGFAHPIDYENAGGPTVEVRVQEMFGEARHPMIAEGRVALILALTSPANRPVQTTKDLPGFWKGSYAAVRSEMRGRYPKHPWPDDPATAEPTRRAKPRGS